MAYVETNPQKLEELNKRARDKEDKNLDFFDLPFDLGLRIIEQNFAYRKPFDAGQGFPYTYKPGGNFIHRPLLDIPHLHLGTTWFTMQGPFRPKFCQIMERDYYRCVTRVGVQNTEKVCKIYWDDLLECQLHTRSVMSNNVSSSCRENELLTCERFGTRKMSLPFRTYLLPPIRTNPGRFFS
ncbi:hypothetical protein FGIG_11461 [Fasciola gigantica]|uniref:Uncharacterized protein n=1 Tax=Fasciola gigantica TaxID=46835 RepID=A0A504YYK3_FASGI|nr:hypothetical protein FGIG_11461 [Fasciola gigantica]